MVDGEGTRFLFSQRPVCETSSGYSVCAWPQQSDRIPAVLAALQSLDGLAGDVYPLPASYRQIGAGVPEAGDVRLGSLPRAWCVGDSRSV